jgi:hypothetical protein
MVAKTSQLRKKDGEHGGLHPIGWTDWIDVRMTMLLLTTTPPLYR